MRKARVVVSLVATSIAAIAFALPARAAVLTPFELFTVPVGSAPGAIVSSPSTARVFVGNTGSGTVSMINEVTDEVDATTFVGPAPHGLALDSTRNRVYVAVGETNTVAVLHARTGALLATYIIPQCTGTTGAWGLAVNTTTNTLYVACYSANTLVSLDAATGVILRSVPTGGGPLGIVADSATNQVYLGMIGEFHIRVINGTTLATTSTISRGIQGGIWGLAFDPVGHRVFAANFLTGTVQTIAAGRVIQTVGGFNGPEWISYDPVRNNVWVPEFNAGNRVSVLDVLTGDITRVPISGTKPTATAVNPALGLAYSANFGTLSVSVISS